MKLLYFDDFRLGVLKGDTVVDVSKTVRSIPQTGPHDLINGLIERFVDYRKKLEKAAASGRGIPLKKVKIRPPLPKPYNDTMVLPDVPASIFEGEAEMALVIGRRASNVKLADAMKHVFGYVNFIDGSARDLPPAGNTFYQMKSRDTFGPMGPYLVTADEVRYPHHVQIRLWVNGALKQDFNTGDMAHKIPRCIEWVSAIHTLNPGDVLATGTNHRGLSAFQDGDRIELEVEGLGRLHVKVRDALKRTWGRDTRLEHEQKGLPGRTPQLSGKYAKNPQ